ncbi:ABC transporter permease subunit [Actinomadura scrupuli]|uniref:ABC transporter permease subunit n=1 Tax=Actinomadura scrupuli TaxID=559629 RepID=UPI003D967E45
MTTTPYRSDLRTGRGGFAQSLRAEWTKFRTVRGWVIGSIAAGLVTVLVGMLSIASDSRPDHVADPRVPIGPGGQAVNDSFYFVHQPLAGDGSITVPVTSLTGRTAMGPQHMRAETQPWAKAGIIVKQKLEQGSAYAALMVTGGHGVRWQYDYTHDTAGTPGAVSPASPRWLRLVRSGDTITGYDSADGSRWNQVGTARLPGLPSTVEAGLFVTSPASIHVTSIDVGTYNPASATAAFGHVELRGQWPQGSWQGGQFGGVGTSGNYPPKTSGGHTRTGSGFTVTGAGDIAPVVGGGALGNGDTIEGFLVGTFAGLIVVIVMATMFITAEYRRGLIRTTLAASPRRGRVLVAKALVISAVTFAVGLVTAIVMIASGRPLAKATGFYLFPVSSLTELRVVAGTAALLAVAAILALAIGAILRHGAGAVTAVIAAIVLPYMLATVPGLPPGAARWLLRVTPAAGFAIRQSIPFYPQVDSTYIPPAGYYPLSPWAGFAVLCGYAVVALGLAVVLLRRRDA